MGDQVWESARLAPELNATDLAIGNKFSYYNLLPTEIKKHLKKPLKHRIPKTLQKKQLETTEISALPPKVSSIVEPDKNTSNIVRNEKGKFVFDPDTSSSSTRSGEEIPYTFPGGKEFREAESRFKSMQEEYS